MPKFVPVEKYPDLTEIAVDFFRTADSRNRGWLNDFNQMLLNKFDSRKALDELREKYENDYWAPFELNETEELFRAILTAKMSDYGMLDEAPSGKSEFLNAINTVFACSDWRVSLDSDLSRKATSLGQIANILSLVQHNKVKNLDAARRLLQEIEYLTEKRQEGLKGKDFDAARQLRKSILAELMKYPNVPDMYYREYFRMLNSEKSKRALLNVYVNKFDAKINDFLKNSGPVIDEQKLEDCLDLFTMTNMIDELKEFVDKDRLRDSTQKKDAIEALDARLEALKVKYNPATILRTNLKDLTEKGLEAAYEEDLTKQIEDLTLKLAELRQEKANDLAAKEREIKDRDTTISSQRSTISELENNLSAEKTSKENAQGAHKAYKDDVIKAFNAATNFIDDNTVETGVFTKKQEVKVDKATMNEKLAAIAKILGVEFNK